MKKIITLLVFLIQFSIAFSQNQQITKFWGNPSEDEKVSNIYQINNNNFYVTINKRSIGNIYSESIVLKVDSNCNVIDSLRLQNYNNRGKKYLLYKIFNFNNRIIASGYAYDSVSLISQLWLAEFDDYLTMLYDTIIENKDTTAKIFNNNILKSTQNKLLVCLQYSPPIHDSINTVVWMLDSSFNIIAENEFNTKTGSNGLSVVEVPATQSFHIITQNEITKINSTDLSNNTIIWKAADDFSQWLNIGGAKRINDSLYLQSCDYPFWNNNSEFGINTYIYIRNKNAIIKDSILIGDMQQSFQKTSSNNIDFISADSIFVTGTNCMLDSLTSYIGDNSIFLWNINVNGQINYQKYYIAYGKRLVVNQLKRTNDGGCFLGGKVWDWQNYSVNLTDVFFLKLDKNGNIIGSQGINEIITQSEILVYPNPASDIINFDIGMFKDFQLLVYNQLGQIVLEDKLTQGNNTITIRNLKKGIYFYKLQNTNAQTISGKFVKE